MKSMFAYLCLGSNDLERSARFYDAATPTVTNSPWSAGVSPPALASETHSFRRFPRSLQRKDSRGWPYPLALAYQ